MLRMLRRGKRLENRHGEVVCSWEIGTENILAMGNGVSGIILAIT